MAGGGGQVREKRKEKKIIRKKIFKNEIIKNPERLHDDDNDEILQQNNIRNSLKRE